MLANADRMRYDPECRSGSLAGLASGALPNRDGRRTLPSTGAAGNGDFETNTNPAARLRVGATRLGSKPLVP